MEVAMTHSECTILIVCYSALDKCKRLMEFLLAENSGAKFILTANGNPQVSAYFNQLKASSPGVHIEVIHNQINRGFIAPSNFAFGLAQTEYVVFLNDDALPPPNWLSMLKAPFMGEPLMAVTGAKGTCNTLDENFVGRKGNQLDYIEFSCAMVRRSLIGVTLFSDYLRFAYGEDADLCLRLRERGLKIAVADFVLAEHFRNTTSRHIPAIRSIMADNFATCRKRWSYYLKHRKFDHQK